jgi:hypothetical protein
MVLSSGIVWWIVIHNLQQWSSPVQMMQLMASKSQAIDVDVHFPHLVVTVVTFCQFPHPLKFRLTIFLHVKICYKLDYLSESYMATPVVPSNDITNPFPCCYLSQN